MPLITRLPFGSTSVTTAATSSSMLSERLIAPSPLVALLESILESIVPLRLPLSSGSFVSQLVSRPKLVLLSRLRSDVLSSDALSLMEILTVTTSPTFIARGSRNRSALVSCQNELPRA